MGCQVAIGFFAGTGPAHPSPPPPTPLLLHDPRRLSRASTPARRRPTPHPQGPDRIHRPNHRPKRRVDVVDRLIDLCVCGRTCGVLRPVAVIGRGCGVFLSPRIGRGARPRPSSWPDSRWEGPRRCSLRRSTIRCLPRGRSGCERGGYRSNQVKDRALRQLRRAARVNAVAAGADSTRLRPKLVGCRSPT